MTQKFSPSYQTASIYLYPLKASLNWLFRLANRYKNDTLE